MTESQNYSPRNHSGEDSASEQASAKTSIFWRILGLMFHRYSLALLVAVVLGLLLYLTMSEDGFIKNRALKVEKEKLALEIERLADENRVLQERLDRLKNDPAYVEDEVRKKLGFIRPGETVYRLSEEPDLSNGDYDSEPTAPKQ